MNWKVFVPLLIVFLLPSLVAADTSVSQYGITFTWDEDDNDYGQFANGDYWVVGPITLTSITPSFTGLGHGWQVNPIPDRDQGFSAGAWRGVSNSDGFDASLVPGLPYIAQPGDSILKTISIYPDSSADCYASCLQTAAVLTVVTQAEADMGLENYFRPPYVAGPKTLYSARLSDLRTDLLPSYPSNSDVPDINANYDRWNSLADRFRRVQMDHVQGRTGRIVRPEDNMQNYQPDNAADYNQALMRLLFNDAVEDKMPLIIGLVQYGIDQYHTILAGQDWPAGGGYEPSHGVFVAFSGVMLDHQGMKDQAVDFPFLEDRAIYTSSHPDPPWNGLVLYGVPSDTGSERTRRDPNECIDGGNNPGTSYQFCCLSQPWKGNALITHMFPAITDVFSGDQDWNELMVYSERWVNHGALTLPDCIEPERFPGSDGLNRDAGYRRSQLVDDFWPIYWSSSIPDCEPDNYCCPSGNTCTNPQSGLGCSGTCCASSNDCIPCTSHDYSACYNDDLWWYDSCGSREDMREDCVTGCSSGACTTPQTCSDLGGVDCCGSDEICLGSSYSGASDCSGTCCDQICTQTCESQGYHCCDSGSCLGTQYSYYCTGSWLCCDTCETSGETGGDLALWLKFDEDLSDNSATDSSGYGNDADCTNCPSFIPGGSHDGSGVYYFDGVDDFLDAGTTTFGLDQSNEFTISMWINVTSMSSTGSLMERGQYAYPFRLNMDTSGQIDTNTRDSSTNTVTGNTNLVTDHWYYIAYSYNDSSIVIYVDGVVDGFTSPSAGDLSIDGESTYIGRRFNADVYFYGLMDDVRVYNRSLSEQEIQDVMAGTQQTYHRADLDRNCEIDIDELFTFMQRWRVSIADVPMREMMDAIALWKLGIGCS